MHWDALTLRAFADATAVVVSGGLLLEGFGGPILGVLGMVAGFAAMLGASVERLKLHVTALERHLEVERGHPRSTKATNPSPCLRRRMILSTRPGS
jgi:hypothetical protein